MPETDLTHDHAELNDASLVRSEYCTAPHGAVRGMTFQDQVRFVLKWGALALVLASTALLAAKVAGEFEPFATVSRQFGWLLLLVGLVLFLGGGMLRPFRKWQFHTYWQHSSWRELVLFRNNAVGRWFLWIDTEGFDRDA